MEFEQLTLFEQPKTGSIVLESSVQKDEFTEEISNKFDFTFDGSTKTIISIPNFPKDFQIGLIIGSSGSGKSSLLRNCSACSMNRMAIWAHAGNAVMVSTMPGLQTVLCL